LGNRRIEFLGAPLDALTMKEAVAAVDRAIERREPLQHASVNAAKVARLQRNHELCEALWSCEMVTADGQPVVWASRLLGRPVPERVAGIDLMEALLERAERRGYGVFLFGARPEVVERAAAAIRDRHPEIRIAGTQHGYTPPSEEQEVVSRIVAAAPDILFVALATPQKELFLARHRDVLRIPFSMGVGGAFDVLAGELARAPREAQRAGLEWAFRLAQEPRRLAYRYLVENTRFVGLLVRELARARTRARGDPPTKRARRSER
jgi:N-acetylglucosaminyldiphosphoundecaprenol N-acetyl-beta-D-mannosaminyltransferase